MHRGIVAAVEHVEVPELGRGVFAAEHEELERHGDGLVPRPPLRARPARQCGHLGFDQSMRV